MTTSRTVSDRCICTPSTLYLAVNWFQKILNQNGWIQFSESNLSNTAELQSVKFLIIREQIWFTNDSSIMTRPCVLKKLSNCRVRGDRKRKTMSWQFHRSQVTSYQRVIWSYKAGSAFQIDRKSLFTIFELWTYVYFFVVQFIGN